MNTGQSSITNESSALLTMEAYRVVMFRAMVVRRIHEGRVAGQSPEAVVAGIGAEQRALAGALMEPALIDVASDTLLKAQEAINANPRYRSTPAQAHESMRQIMYRRAAEAAQSAYLLSQPGYMATLAAMSPVEVDAAVPALRDIKMNEVLGDLLHLENGAPQVIAHIDATAKGVMLEHDALATVFAPDGALYDALMQGLARRLPGATQTEIHHVASRWLSDREAAARLTSDLSANDGAAYSEAVRRSTEWYRQPHDVSPSTTMHTAGLHLHQTPLEREKEKTAHQRAEDIAYTINHAFSCGMTDVALQPVIAAAFGVNVGCGNSSHHGHDYYRSKPELTLKTFAQEAGHYFKGEIIGDFVAVPLTIAMQRFFPNFMNGVRKIVEPLFGWAFRSGANRTTRHWAKEQGLAVDAPEVKDHAEEIYRHEITHLPQAVVWNIFAYPIGVVAQKMGGHSRSYSEIFKSKLVGALISNTILIGGRMIAPGAAQKWDQMTGEHVFLPVSKTVGKMFGVDETTMDCAAGKQKNHEALIWTERVEGGRQVNDIQVGAPTP